MLKRIKRVQVIYSDEDIVKFIITNWQNNLKMDFNPNNNIVKLCFQGMDMEEQGKLTSSKKCNINCKIICS